MLKQWNNPEILELGLENTELGDGPRDNPDATYVDNNGHRWYSYPS